MRKKIQIQIFANKFAKLTSFRNLKQMFSKDSCTV